MKRLTAKEEEIMRIFWENGPMFVRGLLAYYEDPKPHYNTVSTLVRGLEEKRIRRLYALWKYLSILCTCFGEGV